VELLNRGYGRPAQSVDLHLSSGPAPCRQASLRSGERPRSWAGCRHSPEWLSAPRKSACGCCGRAAAAAILAADADHLVLLAVDGGLEQRAYLSEVSIVHVVGNELLNQLNNLSARRPHSAGIHRSQSSDLLPIKFCEPEQ